MQTLEQAWVVLHQIHYQLKRQAQQPAGLAGNCRFAGGLTQQIDHSHQFAGLHSPDGEQIINNWILSQQSESALQQQEGMGLHHPRAYQRLALIELYLFG